MQVDGNSVLFFHTPNCTIFILLASITVSKPVESFCHKFVSSYLKHFPLYSMFVWSCMSVFVVISGYDTQITIRVSTFSRNKVKISQI